MGQEQSNICPDAIQSLQVQKQLSARFIICPHPLYSKQQDFKLLHEKLTNKKFMLRIITADQIQKRTVEARILKRVAFKNDLITKLEHYIFQSNQTYCGKQFKIYLLFQLKSPSTLRQQILMQGKNRPVFRQDQIISGLQNLVNGLLWVRYLKQRHGNINTHNIYYSNGKMILSDPFLCPQSQQYPEKYPSPQKLKQASNQIDQCNFYQADIFSIAMCMLQMIPSVNLSSVYKRNFTINQKILKEQLNKCSHYPRLKNILQSLLINFDNLQNRKKYLQIYTTKSNHLHNQLKASSITEKTVKIHKLGNKTHHQNKKGQSIQNDNKSFFKINQLKPIQINSFGKPQIQTSFPSQHFNTDPQELPNKLQQSRYFNAPIFNSHKQGVPNFQKNVKFNYNKQNEQSPIHHFSQFKTNSSIPTIESVTNPQIPHHLYQFSTASYQPKTRIQPFYNNPTTISRSNSDYSVKSQVIVYEPNKNNFALDLISPRQPNTQPNVDSNKQPQYYKEIQQKLDFTSKGYYPTKYEGSNKNLLQIINGGRQPVKSIGILQCSERPSIQQQSFVIQQSSQKQQFTSLINQNVHKNLQNQNSLQSLPMKLSILVKDKVQQQKQRAQTIRSNFQEQDQAVNTTLQLRTPQKSCYSPPHLNNRTIPQQEQQSQQSMEGQKPHKGEYRIQVYQNGSKYEGFFYNNQRQGYGTFYYKDGGYYQGQWKNNLMNGFGKLFYDNQKLAYEGEWYGDQFHGKGKVYNDNWEQLIQGSIDYTNFQNHQAFWIEYDGQLSHDIKEGLGKWKFSNGEYYLGQFKEDMPHGKGTFYSLKGIIKGIWSKGKLVKDL